MKSVYDEGSDEYNKGYNHGFEAAGGSEIWQRLEQEISKLQSRCWVAEQALRECEEYFDQRADAEYLTDRPFPVGNEEMRLLGIVREALGKRDA